MYRLHAPTPATPTARADLIVVGATLASDDVCTSHSPDGDMLPLLCCRRPGHAGDHWAAGRFPTGAAVIDGRCPVLAEWDDNRATDGRLED